MPVSPMEVEIVFVASKKADIASKKAKTEKDFNAYRKKAEREYKSVVDALASKIVS